MRLFGIDQETRVFWALDYSVVVTLISWCQQRTRDDRRWRGQKRVCICETMGSWMLPVRRTGDREKNKCKCRNCITPLTVTSCTKQDGGLGIGSERQQLQRGKWNYKECTFIINAQFDSPVSGGIYFRRLLHNLPEKNINAQSTSGECPVRSSASRGHNHEATGGNNAERQRGCIAHFIGGAS